MSDEAVSPVTDNAASGQQIDHLAARHRPADNPVKEGYGAGDFCNACSQSWPCDAELLRRERDAAEADAKALAAHLRNAIHDLIADWNLTGGPRLNYDEANAVLAAHDARVSHNHSDSATDDECGARNHPPETVAIVAHTPPFDSVRDERRRP